MLRHLDVLTVVFGNTFCYLAFVVRRLLRVYALDGEHVPMLMHRHVALVEALHSGWLNALDCGHFGLVLAELVDGTIVGRELVKFSWRFLLLDLVDFRQRAAPLMLHFG